MNTIMTSKLDSANLPGDAQSMERPADPTFNRIAVISTALSFAAVLGTAACLDRGTGQGLDFRWHWRAALWMGLGVVAAVRLWQLVWRAQSDTTGKAAKRLVRFCIALLVGALAVFLYPILFVASDRFDDVLTGLSLAVAVLTFVGWMIYRVARGFADNDSRNPSARE